MANIETLLFTQADEIRESACITMKNEPAEAKAVYMAGHIDNSIVTPKVLNSLYNA